MTRVVTDVASAVPLAAAVVEDVPGTERQAAHRRAARALGADPASEGTVAAHLMRSAPLGEPDAGAALVAAAAEATRRGDPAGAAARLDRALRERAPGDDRGHLLGLLAIAAHDAERPDARERLYDALRELRDPAGRAEVLGRLAALQALAGGDERLVEVLDEERAAAGDARTRVAIEAAALDALLPLPGRQVERGRRAQAVAGAAGDPALERTVSAHLAWAAIELGTGSAADAAQLALDALRDDALLEASPRRFAYHLAVRALVLTDRHAAARAAIAALRGRAGGSPALHALAAWHAAELALRTGRAEEAEREARAALAAAGSGLTQVAGGALVTLLHALAEQGAYDDAEALLEAWDPAGPLERTAWAAGVRHARARLALGRGDYERAVAEARGAGALREADAHPSPTATPWRSTAAVALARAGRLGDATLLADEDLARATRFGAPGPLVTALHARALAERDPAVRIALCRRALDLDGGESFDGIRVRLELGAALTRTGGRTEAREQLRRAAADADAAGAVALADRARGDLAATGLGARRAASEGAAALTPRQRQVSLLAAAGKANREIAHALVLSPKTVETHLAAAFRKLGVSSRTGLAAALA